MSDEPFELLSSDEWSDDPWYINQEKREFIKTFGVCGGRLPDCFTWMQRACIL